MAKNGKKPADAPLDSQGRPWTSKRCKRELAALNVEYKEQDHDTPAGQSRRGAIRAELRQVVRALEQLEEKVVVNVPAAATGEFYTVGPRVFPPGKHTVSASVAEYLLYMIDQNRSAELKRLQSNGRTIDLGTIGDKARMAEMARE